MLLELAIRNFAIIRNLRVQFHSGLQAMTGETGAGKSIIIDALGAVLGTRVTSDFVRTDETNAWIEAVFAIDDAPNGMRDYLDEMGVELEDATLILSRDIRDTGRSIARINGRTVPVRALSEIGQYLVDIHGQSEHLSLLRPAEHLLLLDRYAGVESDRNQLGVCVEQYLTLRREISRLQSGERERAQRVDLLRFQIGEIDSANLSRDEDVSLDQERQVLANAERLRETANLAYSLIAGLDSYSDAEPQPALDALRRASMLLDQLADVDQAGASDLARQGRDALFLNEELAPAVRTYAEGIEADPARLEIVEDRITLIRELQRKYGASIDDILEYRDDAAAELDELDSSDERVQELEQQLTEVKCEIAGVVSVLSQQRRNAASELEDRVENAIAELDMGGALFRVDFSDVSSQDTVEIERNGTKRDVPFDSTGMDRIEFLIAPNSGEEPRPLARIASGGETARLMLALKSILSDVDATPTLVFDEIDVGVGGRSGQPVGEKLWNLSRNHQVIVISHLPQIAAFAEHHLKIEKTEVSGRIETTVHEITDDERRDEIAAMLDGVPISEASRQSALEMMKRASGMKSARTGN